MSFLDTLIFGYRTVLNAGTEVIQRSKLNFVGATIADNPVTGATDVTLSGGTAPTGTGFRHVTSGVEDGAAEKVNLASTAYVTGTLPVANGGTGQTSGTVVFLNAVQTLTMKVIDAASNTITGLTNSSIASGAAIALSKIVNPTGSGVVKTVSGVIQSAASAIVNADIDAAAAIALSKIVNPTGTGLVKVVSGVIQAASAALVNADVDAAAAIAGTKIAPNFGSQAVGTTGYFYTATTNPASVGNIRMAHGDKIAYRNSGASADATFFHTSGDTAYMGINSGFTDAAYQFIFCPTQTIYIGVASNYFWIVNNNLLEANAPILGYSGSEFGIHGSVVSAMGNANYTAATADKRVGTIEITAVMTGTRTMTWPHPSSADRSYKKTFIIAAATLNSVIISTGTGTSVTIATNKTQTVEFTPAGVRPLTAAL